jgi:hypothetical protein
VLNFLEELNFGSKKEVQESVKEKKLIKESIKRVDEFDNSRLTKCV